MSRIRSQGISFTRSSLLCVSISLLGYTHFIAAEFDVLYHLLIVLHLSIIDLDCLAQRTCMAASVSHLGCPFTLRHFSGRLALAKQLLIVFYDL